MYGFLNAAGDAVAGTVPDAGGTVPAGSHAREVLKIGHVGRLAGRPASERARLKAYPIDPGTFDASTHRVTGRDYARDGNGAILIASNRIAEVLETAPLTQQELDDRAAAAAAQAVAALAAAQANAVRLVNERAEAARLQYFTPGDGQAMSYREKASEADACLAAHDAQTPPPPGKFPLLDSEVPHKGADTLAVAALVAQPRDAWKAIEAEINKARVAALAGIESAEDLEDVAAVLDGLSYPVAGE